MISAVDMHVEIQRSPEDVFAFLANAENMPKWRAPLEEVKQITDGPPQKGTRYRFVRRKPHIESTTEWVEFEPPRRLAWVGPPERVRWGTIELSGGHTLTPIDGGTEINSHFETEFGGPAKLIGRFLGRTIKKELEADYQSLKRLLEGESRANAPEGKVRAP